MSRTNKDKPAHASKHKSRILKKPYERELARKEEDVEWHWLSACPRWFRRMFMTRPQRRSGRVWEHEIAKTDINHTFYDSEYAPLEDKLEELEAPGVGRKPHKYYY